MLHRRLDAVTLSQAREADILVLATPVYGPLPGEMQNLLNRLVPLFDSILEMRNDHTRARLRQDVKISKIVLVSTCGWWEKRQLWNRASHR
jgi:hypothetical protein